MTENKPKYQNYKILAAPVTILTAFAVLIWHVIAHDVPLPVSLGDAVSIAMAEGLGLPVSGASAGTVGVPIRLKIPRIHVNAAVQPVGLLPDGSMGVPKLPRDTAWYMLGPKPGEVGSAVIAGHVNWWNGLTGSFQDLKRLKPGDKVIVRDEKGGDITFIVRKVSSFAAAADATDIFVSNDGKSHLNLVTCSGVWVTKAKQYSKRLVVFADRQVK